MSDSDPNNGNLINFIASTVEHLRDQMDAMRAQVGVMPEQMDGMRGQMVEISDQVGTLGGQMEALRDQMATKSDVARLETKIEVEISVVRGDIEQVQLRIDSIDRTLKARLDQMDAEIARLRSVVYLLVKDRPELLRLLGQPPSASQSPS
ncbi:MAG: hypothetical protein M3268_00840 [Acidobacteriota bacterium]|nr:hypothetical protein [Acidobacteriota bacterium]